MNKLSYLLLSILSLHASTSLAITGEQAIEVVAGIMKGVIEKDNLEELKKCMNDADQIAVLIEEVQEDLSSKDLFKMFEGIKLLGEVISMVPVKLKDCETIKPDVEKFEEWAMVFTRPKELSERLLRNLPKHF